MCPLKKRLGALLCALVMCLALLSPASALEEVCFTSLNNKLLPWPPTPCPSGPEASSTCPPPCSTAAPQTPATA